MAVSISPNRGSEEVSRFLSNEYNVLTARIFLGMILIVVSIDKIADPLAFAKSISDYRLVTGPSAIVLATVLPWMELLTGMAILFGLFLRGSSLLAGAILSIFSLAVVTALVRGLDINCGCFTQDPDTAKIGWMKISENAILLSISGFLYFSSSTKWSLEHYYRQVTTQ